MRKLTTTEFIKKARKKHEDRYDYSKVEYVNAQTKVCIICPIHGEFWQLAHNHLSGKECFRCSYDKRRSKSIQNINGVINDYPTTMDDGVLKIYSVWKAIIARCFNDNIKEKKKCYKKARLCEEWHIFTNFLSWYLNNRVEGWHIDKDIIIKGNKVYSPDTCCFVPNEINSFFAHNSRNIVPKGFSTNKKHNKFISSISNKVFDNESDAYKCFCLDKEIKAKRLAEKYKDNLDIRVYNRLINYKEIEEWNYD